jgi:hypothetical protein
LPFLNWIVHMIESELIIGETMPPRGTISEYALTEIAPWGQIFTQE